MTWALKDRSDVNRTFWEWSPEEDSMLKFRIPLLSRQHAAHQNLLGAACLFASACRGRPGPGLAKPSLLRVRPLVEGSDCDLWAWEPRSQDHSFP